MPQRAIRKSNTERVTKGPGGNYRGLSSSAILIRTMKIGRYIAVLALGLLLGVGAYYAFLPQAPARAQEMSPEERARLQAQYDQLQKEIEQYQKIIDDTKAKAKTIQGDVTILDTQVKKAQAEINQRTSTINTLASTINQKSKTIATLESRLQDGRASLAKLLREKSLNDNTSLVVLALSGGTLTDFFANADRIDSIDEKLREKFDELRGVKTLTEGEKEALAQQQSKQLDAKKEVEAKKSVIDQSKTEKKNLLTATKNDEAAYNKVLAERQAKAAAIRAALFPLRDAAAIQFGDALKFAQAAQKVTGTDPGPWRLPIRRPRLWGTIPPAYADRSRASPRARGTAARRAWGA